MNHRPDVGVHRRDGKTYKGGSKGAGCRSSVWLHCARTNDAIKSEPHSPVKTHSHCQRISRVHSGIDVEIKWLEWWERSNKGLYKNPSKGGVGHAFYMYMFDLLRVWRPDSRNREFLVPDNFKLNNQGSILSAIRVILANPEAFHENWRPSTLAACVLP